MHRATNTGSLAIEDSNIIVERILWERVNPNKDLNRLIENNEALLFYSKGESSSTIFQNMKISLLLMIHGRNLKKFSTKTLI